MLKLALQVAKVLSAIGAGPAALMALPLAVPIVSGVAALAGGIVAGYFGGSLWLGVIALAAIGGFVWIWLTFGLKPALAWALAAGAFFIDQNAARRGAENERLATKRAADRVASQRERINAEIAAEPESAARARLRRWSVPD